MSHRPEAALGPWPQAFYWLPPPDISINYTRVTLSYSTRSEGGLTEKDFEGAGVADRCA